MDLRRMNTISIIVVIAFIVLFFSVQLSLTERIYEDMKISPSIISHYEVPDSDGKNYSLGIPSAYLDEEVTTSKNDISEDGIQIQPTAIPKSEVTTIPPTRPAPFNPVGIPFSRISGIVYSGITKVRRTRRIPNSFSPYNRRKGLLIHG